MLLFLTDIGNHPPQSDYVVTYVTHSWGGAAQFAELAEKQKKIIVSLS